MRPANGGFEDGEDEWSLFGNASIIVDPVHDGAKALELKATYGFGGPVGASALQTFAVSAGEELNGWIVLTQSLAPATTFDVLFGGRSKYSINSNDMVPDVWVPWQIVFDEIDEAAGDALFGMQLGTVAWGGFGAETFAIDSLEIPEAGEATMIAENLMKWLDAEGFGTENTDLFLSHMPDAPDACVTVYDESAPALIGSQALSFDRYGVQIMARGTDYQTVRDKIVLIHETLLGFQGLLTAGGRHVIMVDCNTSPTSIGRDDNKRIRWVSHYLLTVVSVDDQFRS